MNGNQANELGLDIALWSSFVADNDDRALQDYQLKNNSRSFNNNTHNNNYSRARENIVPELGTVRASSWSYEDGDTPVIRDTERRRLDNENLGGGLRDLELAVSLAEDRVSQVGFLLSALGRERRKEDTRPGLEDSSRPREVLLSDIETYIRQIGGSNKFILLWAENLFDIFIRIGPENSQWSCRFVEKCPQESHPDRDGWGQFINQPLKPTKK